MGKERPSAAIIATRLGTGVSFAAAAQNHIMLGDNTGGTGAHSGLHSMNVADGQYPTKTVDILEYDSRVEAIYRASVSLRGGKTAKESTFFPATMDWTQVKRAITEAWEDCQIYAPQSEIYQQMMNKYGLRMIGQATINRQRIWIGSTKSGKTGSAIETAFPAVNNKFS